MDIHNSKYNYMTQTPIPKLILTLSVPTIISMMGTNIYNLVDTAFVGRLGNSASGAVGVVFGFMTILQAIGFLFGQGAGSMVSRKLGSKDVKEATRIASTGFFMAFGIATLVAIICAFNLDFLVSMLGSTDTIAPYAKIYISFILSTAPFMVTSFTLNNILRYEGRATFGMIGLITGGIINIAGDALFMQVMNMGIAGAGLSTAISQIISFTILISMFARGKTSTRISIREVTFINNTPLDIVGTGLPSLIRQLLNSLGTIVMNFQAAKYAGDEAVAAMSIVSRVTFFLFAVALGIGQGFQPVSGFNYGAKKYKRLKEAYRTTMLFAEIAVVVFSIPAIIWAKEIVALFRDDPNVIAIGERALILYGLALFALPLGMIAEMLMQSTGHKKSASFLSTLRGGLIYIPLLLILPLFRGLAGIQEAQPISYILSAIPGLIIGNRFLGRLTTDNSVDKDFTEQEAT